MCSVPQKQPLATVATFSSAPPALPLVVDDMALLASRAVFVVGSVGGPTMLGFLPGENRRDSCESINKSTGIEMAARKNRRMVCGRGKMYRLAQGMGGGGRGSSTTTSPPCFCFRMTKDALKWRKTWVTQCVYADVRWIERVNKRGNRGMEFDRPAKMCVYRKELGGGA
jgi:hypothetical protein